MAEPSSKSFVSLYFEIRRSSTIVYILYIISDYINTRDVGSSEMSMITDYLCQGNLFYKKRFPIYISD